MLSSLIMHLQQPKEITFQDKNEIDLLLADYILHNNKYKLLTDLTREKIAKIFALYGNKRKLTIYRGICFYRKDKYLEYLEHLKNGTITIQNKVSSWTKDLEIAKQYSKVEDAIEYSHRKDLLNAEKTADCYSLVLKQEIAAHQAVVMPYAFAPGFKYEKEVILFPGTYSIDIEDYDL